MSITPLDPQSSQPRASQPVSRPVTASASKATPPATPSSPDDTAAEATVSDAAESVRKGMEQVQETDGLRTEKIFELRGKIASGEYKIDADSLAKRLVDHL